MSRSKRSLLISGTVIGALAFLCLGAIYTLQSGWFQEKIRQRVVSKLEQSTGAQVNIKSLRLDWHNGVVEFRSVVIRGSEPPDGAPLFAADDVRVGFRLASLLKRSLDLQSVQIQRPEVHLLIRPDGSTNVPRPQNNALQKLIDLRVHRFTAERGMLTVNFRRLPLQFNGREMEAHCRFDRAREAYELQFSSKDTSVEHGNATSPAVNVDGRVRIEQSAVIVQAFHIARGDSNVTASGAIKNFANPTADFQLSAQVQADDASEYPLAHSWRAGEATLAGGIHYDSQAGTSFRGNIAGRKLSYHSGAFDISAVDLESELSGSPDSMQFTHLVIKALGAKLTGSAKLADLNTLDLNASVARLDLNRVSSRLFERSLPWDALADGRIHFSCDLSKGDPQSLLKAELNLQPAGSALPVSGFVDLVYRTPARSLEFNSSHLNLPGTQVSFSGVPSTSMQVNLESTDLTDLGSALGALHTLPIAALPAIESNGHAHFDGTVAGLLTAPQIAGSVALSNFRFRDKHWDVLQSQIGLSPQKVALTSFRLTSGPARITGSGHLDLANWIPAANSQIRVDGHFQSIDLNQPAFQIPGGGAPPWTKFLSGGIASGSVALSGRFSNPIGRVQLHIDNPDLQGTRMSQIQLSLALEQNQVKLTQGRAQSGSAVISFSGTYTHRDESWRDGQLAIKVDSNGFPLAGVPEWRRFEPELNGRAEIHGQGAIRIASGQIEPAVTDGVLKLHDLTYNGELFGALTVNAATSNNVLTAKLGGDLRGHSFSGTSRIQLAAGSPMKSEFHFDHLDLAVLPAIVYPAQNATLPFDGTTSGDLALEGPFLRPREWRSKLRISQVELRPKLPKSFSASALVFHNVAPVIVDVGDGVAKINSFGITGNSTALTVAGSIHYDPKSVLDVRINGSVNLEGLKLFDASLQSSGRAIIAANLGGTIHKSTLTGTLDIAQGMFFESNLPNGLSNVNGRIVFNRDRATIQKLDAQVGGGTLSLTGFVGFGNSGPLVWHVQANAGNVRLRYGAGISVTANADLRLTGSSQSSILSGTATVSRVVFNPNTDIGNLLAAFSAAEVAPANSNEFVSGLHMDVAVESAPNLQLNTALSRDVEAEIDVRLRGTPDHPLLLGNISANQGDIKVFGTKYSINHGEVRFQNTVRIEPVLDLDLQTQTRGITVNITISGTINKLNIAYRSDPPLQPRDIIALLTVGRTPSTTSNVQTAQNPSDVTTQGAGTVLGQAISSPPSRLSKLFGITNVKIDPMVQGIITNTPQARLTLEQQVSRDLTVTYVTNLSQTSEQIFRVEWALNPQYSVVALRDENGEFGIDIQYKKRFR